MQLWLIALSLLITSSEGLPTISEGTPTDAIVPETSLAQTTSANPSGKSASEDTGPELYSSPNFQGSSWLPGLSVPDTSLRLGEGGLSSIKVPKGWCATLYTKNNYMGVSTRICGPKNVKLSDLSLEHHVAGESKLVKTNWNDQAASMTVQQYAYVQQQPDKKCEESCAIQAYEHKGSVICQRSHGLEDRHTVGNSFCKETGLHFPGLPVLKCPATTFCSEWKTSPPANKCPKKCGFPGATIYGSVFCTSRNRGPSDGKLPKEVQSFTVKAGTVVKDEVCNHWHEDKPDVPTTDCPATEPCVKWATLSPEKLGKKCQVGCGHLNSTLVGKIICNDTVHNTQVNDEYCKAGSKPQVPTQLCNATAHCTVWKRLPPAGKCNATQTVLKGTVICTDASVGTTLADAKCAGARPPVVVKKCPPAKAAKVAPYWNASEVTCPQKHGCGQPASDQVGTVDCVKTVKGKLVVQPDSACSGKKPPGMKKTCPGTKACPVKGPTAVGIKKGNMVLHKAATLAGPSGHTEVPGQAAVAPDNHHRWVRKWPRELGKLCSTVCEAKASILTGGLSCRDIKKGLDVPEIYCQGPKPKVPVEACAANPGVGSCACQQTDDQGNCAGYGANTDRADFCTVETSKGSCTTKKNKMDQKPCRWNVVCDKRCTCDQPDERGDCSGDGADANPGFCEVTNKDACVAKKNKAGQAPCRYKKVQQTDATRFTKLLKKVQQHTKAAPVNAMDVQPLKTANCCCTITSYAGPNYKHKLGVMTQCEDGAMILPDAMKNRVSSFALSSGCHSVKTSNKLYATSQPSAVAKVGSYHLTVKKSCG